MLFEDQALPDGEATLFHLALYAWRSGVEVTRARFGEGELLDADGKGNIAKLEVRFAGGEKVLAAKFVKRL